MRPFVRPTVVVLALILATSSLVMYGSWASEQRRLAALLEQVQAETYLPGIGARVRRANDPLEARLRALRPLIAHYMDPTWILDVDEEARVDTWQSVTQALEEAQKLAADISVRRPTSWEGPMVLGAAAYLTQPRGPQSMSLAGMENWEGPLLRAAELAPNRLEPASYLTIAYVQNWQALSAAQRRGATSIVKRAFRDPATFNLVIEHWLRLVPDRREALELLPDEPFAWRRLAAIFRRQGEWNRFLAADDRHRAAADREIGRTLDEAEARVSGGDYGKGTTLFHQAAAALEPDLRNLSQLERILHGMPAGPVARNAARNLTAWLDWTLRLSVVRPCPLGPEHLRRLAGAAEDVESHQAALAELLAGDLAAAERIDRQHPMSPDWAPYLILKAEALIERGEFDAAELALLRAKDGWEQHPTFLRANASLAEAMDNQPRLEEIRRRQGAIRSSSWRGSQMTWRQGIASLTLVPEDGASGLEIEFLDVPPRGRSVETVWNGQSVERSIVMPGDEPLQVQWPIESDVALLELRSPDRRPLAPGRITLLRSGT